MSEETSPVSSRCVKCGRESAVKEAFVIPSKPNDGSDEVICFECAAKGKALSQLASILFILAMGAFLYFLSPGSWLATTYLYLGAGFIVAIPFVVLHELSHALAARWLGFHVFAIHLGLGKPFGEKYFLGIKWVLHPFPIGGLTLVAGPESPDYRRRIFLLTLAGPAFHALVILLSLALLPLLTTQPGYTIAQIILWSNFLTLATNLYPRKIPLFGSETGTDGWTMLNIFRLKPEALVERFAGYYVLKAISIIESGDKPQAKEWVEQGLQRYPNNPFMLNTAGYVYLNLREYQKAREAFVKILAMDVELKGGMRYIVMNNIAYSNLMLDDPTLLAEADDYSAQALKNISWQPEIQGTRGSVLAALGQFDESLELLKQAMRASFIPDNKASLACWISIAERGRGNREQAKKYLETARQLSIQCDMLERAARVLETN